VVQPAAAASRPRCASTWLKKPTTGNPAKRRLGPQSGQGVGHGQAPRVEVQDHEPRPGAGARHRIRGRAGGLHLEAVSLGRLADPAQEHEVVDERDQGGHEPSL
jgi:hypothetical protein